MLPACQSRNTKGADLLHLPAGDGTVILARQLVDGGLAPVRCMSHPDRRELVIWGMLSLSRSLDNGLIQARMLNEPGGPGYWARHASWLDRISVCNSRAGELAKAYCNWQVGCALMRYGPAKEATASEVREKLEEAFAGLTKIPSWRSAFCRWLLDPVACRLARLAYGPDFTAAEYNRIVLAQPLAARVSEEFLSLMPALGWILAVQAASPGGSKVVNALFGASGISSEELFYGLRRALMMNYGKRREAYEATELARAAFGGSAAATQPDDELLGSPGELPSLDHADSVVCEGRFSAACWKLLVRLPRSAVRALFEPRLAMMPAKLQALEYFSAVGARSVPAVAIKAYAGKQIFHELTVGFPRWTRFTVMFLREVKNRIDAGRPLRDFLNEEFIAVVDWLSADGITRNHPVRNASWASLVRRQRAWHQDPGLTNRVDSNARWDSPVEGFSFNGCVVTPLISVSQLAEEGLRMQHCAGGYWRSCLSGQSRLFSLASPEGRSTLELARSDDSWSIAQLRGPGNARPPRSHEETAEEISRRCRAIIPG